MPPDGKLDASGSPLISSLPLNSATARPSARRRDERVVLLGGDAGERLEPVRVVRRAVLDRPVLHRGGDDVGGRRVERLALGDGAAQRLVDVARQPAALDVVVERERSEDLGRLRPHAAAVLALFLPHSMMPCVASCSADEPIASSRRTAINHAAGGCRGCEKHEIRTPSRYGARRSFLVWLRPGPEPGSGRRDFLFSTQKEKSKETRNESIEK